MSTTKGRPVGASHQSDRDLLVSAERAAAADGLPVTLGGCRRRRLLGWDALSTTWSAWDVRTGAPVWIQVLRPAWATHPPMVRRFVEAESSAGVRSFVPLVGAALPARVLVRPGTPLRELSPRDSEEPVGLPLRAAILAHGLEGLAALHRDERGLGGDLRDWLTVSRAGPRLVDRVAFGASFDSHRDLQRLSEAVLELAPHARDPIAALARTWCERPPPDAADGAMLVVRAMATHLAWLRHQLVRSRRSRTRRTRLGRLSRLIRRLEGVQAPPVGEACLAVGAEGQHVRVWSDGETMRGGAALPGHIDVHAGELPVVWSAAGGLDPVAGRLLVRAWSSAHQGLHQAEAERVQDALGSRAVAPELFVRWLKAARRLRSARLLLDAESRVRVVR